MRPAAAVHSSSGAAKGVSVEYFSAADSLDLAAREWIEVELPPVPEDREAGFHDFSAAEKVVEFFQDMIGPFPYEKMANVQSKTRYGGMENAGNIFYSERAVRGDGSNEGLIEPTTCGP